LLTIRSETPQDEAEISRIHEEAFGQEAEGELVGKLRNRGMLTISLVALYDGRVVGHIAFRFQAIAMGPMAVVPACQRKGIGSQLVRAGLKECRHLGYDIVVLVGHPDYYPRFGFVLAGPKGIECEFEVPDEAWMLLELRENALAGKRGTVSFQAEFSEAM
jgi:putative acetyltransferase